MSMRKPISYPGDQRERAKVKGIPLVTIDFDDRHCKHGGRVTYQGQADGEHLPRVLKYLLAVLKKNGVEPME